jgi:hypothetical protein
MRYSEHPFGRALQDAKMPTSRVVGSAQNLTGAWLKQAEKQPIPTPSLFVGSLGLLAKIAADEKHGDPPIFPICISGVFDFCMWCDSALSVRPTIRSSALEPESAPQADHG